MGRLFGTDGARGVAVTELSCETAMQIGRAAALVLTKQKKGEGRARILIGKDTRVSSDILEAALAAGILSVGADAELLGIVPTPAVAYLVKRYGADAGVMISASHNSVEYNGIKLFSGTGFKLPDEVENEIEALILDHPDRITLRDGTAVGRIARRETAVDDYVDRLLETAGEAKKDLRVLIDCANGSASATAEKLFRGLGTDFALLSAEPDGCNINENCGSTHLDRLCDAVKKGKYDLGIAFDGDADRCLAADENGKAVDGDKLIAILSERMKERGTLKNDTAVVTVMSNLGFHTYMKKHRLGTVCTAVGDRYVLEEMLKNGYNIGGEQSGHIIFLDHATTGDGQLTAVQLIRLLAETGAPLSSLTAEIEDFPQLLLNVRIPEQSKGKWQKDERIAEAIREAEQALGEDGRILVRESGTEPLVRVMIEGKNEADVTKWTNRIADEIKARLA
ncbi:MAG: phosphoglucosamine mutase [Bacteroides sp.]|nr:phosphoglucosamine mutase [Eubacterium sp.]MCM1418069.1 phosphoglucosamine mutase [Roseburia sp.]MCM1462213.1 phosphoglucosamine mutase [Bacteroides sp.]